MRIVVIGCGLAGVTSAWFLQQHGHSVTVVERAQGAARETSYANGSMLTPSLADPWNAPGAVGALLRSFGNDAAPLLLRAQALPGLVLWGLRFLRNASRQRFERAFLANVRFAQYSQQVMQQLLQRHPLEFAYVQGGTIKIFRDADSFAEHRRRAEWLLQAGVQHQVLNPDQLLALEPELADVIDSLVGGLHFGGDEVGNAQLFCEQLVALAAREGVTFRFGETVRDGQLRHGELHGVSTDHGEVPGDAFLLAAGSFSWPLGMKLGVRVPVRPAKGYSLTVPLQPGGPAPRYPIVDDALHAAVVPLGGDRLRVAGTAEFTGFDLQVTPARIENLRGLLGRVFPRVDARSAPVDTWCGLRPLTADGMPLVGRTRISNLFVNTGHGALGWTQACGSGQAIADLMSGRQPAFDLHPFAATRA